MKYFIIIILTSLAFFSKAQTSYLFNDISDFQSIINLGIEEFETVLLENGYEFKEKEVEDSATSYAFENGNVSSEGGKRIRLSITPDRRIITFATLDVQNYLALKNSLTKNAFVFQDDADGDASHVLHYKKISSPYNFEVRLVTKRVSVGSTDNIKKLVYDSVIENVIQYRY